MQQIYGKHFKDEEVQSENLEIFVPDVSYYEIKECRKVTQSHSEAIFLAIAISVSNKGSESFIMFNRPCEHDDYVPGSSWVEMCDISERQLRSMKQKFVKRVKRKDFNKDYKNDLIVSYTDSQNRTIYKVNYALFLDRLEGDKNVVFLTDKTSIPKTTKCRFPYKRVRNSNIVDSNSSKEYSRANLTQMAKPLHKIIGLKKKEKKPLPPSPPSPYDLNIPTSELQNYDGMTSKDQLKKFFRKVFSMDELYEMIKSSDSDFPTVFNEFWEYCLDGNPKAYFNIKSDASKEYYIKKFQRFCEQHGKVEQRLSIEDQLNQVEKIFQEVTSLKYPLKDWDRKNMKDWLKVHSVEKFRELAIEVRNNASSAMWTYDFIKSKADK